MRSEQVSGQGAPSHTTKPHQPELDEVRLLARQALAKALVRLVRAKADQQANGGQK
jgi:hypothetical protein